MAQRYRTRPSEILRIDDDYTAYCLDEACEYIIGQLGEGKRPFFGRPDSGGRGRPSGNAAAVELLKQLGAEVRKFD